MTRYPLVLGRNQKLELLDDPTITPVAVGLRLRSRSRIDDSLTVDLQRIHRLLNDALVDLQLIRPIVVVVESSTGNESVESELPSASAGTWAADVSSASALFNQLMSPNLPELKFSPTTLTQVRQILLQLRDSTPLMSKWLDSILRMRTNVDGTIEERVRILTNDVNNGLRSHLGSISTGGSSQPDARPDSGESPMSRSEDPNREAGPSEIKRIKHVRIQDLGGFVGKVELNLDADVVLIYGPNGSGKSTLANILSELLNRFGPLTPLLTPSGGTAHAEVIDQAGSTHHYTFELERGAPSDPDPDDPFTPELRYKLSVLSDRQVEHVVNERPDSITIGQAMAGVHDLGVAIVDAIKAVLEEGGFIDSLIKDLDDEVERSQVVPKLEKQRDELRASGVKAVLEHLSITDLQQLTGVRRIDIEQLQSGTAPWEAFRRIYKALREGGITGESRHEQTHRHGPWLQTLMDLERLVDAGLPPSLAESSPCATLIKSEIERIDRRLLRRLVEACGGYESRPEVHAIDEVLANNIATARNALKRWMDSSVLFDVETELDRARRASLRSDYAECRRRLQDAKTELQVISDALPKTQWDELAKTLTEAVNSLMKRSNAIEAIRSSGDGGGPVKVDFQGHAKTAEFRFYDDRRPIQLSAGQYQQFALVWMIAQRMLLHKNEVARKCLGHRCLILDDAAATHDIDSVGREVISLRQLAYGQLDSTSTQGGVNGVSSDHPRIQLIVMTHDRELADRYLQLLAPPHGCTMLYHELPRIAFGTKPSSIRTYQVKPQQPLDSEEDRIAVIQTILRHITEGRYAPEST